MILIKRSSNVRVSARGSKRGDQKELDSLVTGSRRHNVRVRPVQAMFMTGNIIMVLTPLPAVDPSPVAPQNLRVFISGAEIRPYCTHVHAAAPAQTTRERTCAAAVLNFFFSFSADPRARPRRSRNTRAQVVSGKTAAADDETYWITMDDGFLFFYFFKL